MAKVKTTPYTLQLGRSQPFRRTVQYADKSRQPVQFVFEPGVDVDLTDEEVAALSTEIRVRTIALADRDAKGRLRDRRAEAAPDADAAIQKLEKSVEELSAQNAKLKADNEKMKADLDKATKPSK